MKNLFLTLVFVLATSFSFAAINSNETVIEKPNALPVTEVCASFTLSCGLGGSGCAGSLSELIENVLTLDDIFC